MPQRVRPTTNKSVARDTLIRSAQNARSLLGVSHSSATTLASKQVVASSSLVPRSNSPAKGPHLCPQELGTIIPAPIDAW